MSALCVFTLLQTVSKELNLKFKIKETPHGIKREDDCLTVLHLKLKS